MKATLRLITMGNRDSNFREFYELPTLTIQTIQEEKCLSLIWPLPGKF